MSLDALLERSRPDVVDPRNVAAERSPGPDSDKETR